MKRLLAFFLCLMLCLLLIPAALAEEAAENATDTTAPTVSNITLSATSVTAPGTLTVTATASDDISGIKSFYIEFYNRETQSSLGTTLELKSSGKYRGSIYVGQYTNGGEYIIEYVCVIDKAGNRGYYYGAGETSPIGMQKLPTKCYSRSFTVQNITDTTAPTVSNLTLSATSVTAPGTVTVTATASDDISGINNFFVQFYNRETKSSLSTNLELKSSGKYRGSIYVGQYTNDGEYIIEYVCVIDKAGNRGYYYGAGETSPIGMQKLPTKCYSRSFEVIDPNALPRITTQPVDKTAEIGTTTKFTVKACGASEYQWQYRVGPTGTWRNSSSAGANTATLSVEATSARNGYQFRCKVTNPVGTAYSNAAALTVMAVPSITTQPTDKDAAIGSTAKFTVKASGKQLSYQWYYRKTPDSSWIKCSSEGATSRTLSVEVKNYHNGYQFRCKVTNPVGTAYSEAATLTAMAAPAVTAQPQSRSAQRGETVSFTVKASGRELSYQWYYRKTPDGSWIRCGSEGATSRTLSVEVKSYHNGYQFRCRITNPVGKVYTDEVTLSVVS